MVTPNSTQKICCEMTRGGCSAACLYIFYPLFASTSKVLLTHCTVPPPVTKAEPGQVLPGDYPPGAAAVVLIHRFAAAPCHPRSVATIQIDVCAVCDDS